MKMTYKVHFCNLSDYRRVSRYNLNQPHTIEANTKVEAIEKAETLLKSGTIDKDTYIISYNNVELLVRRPTYLPLKVFREKGYACIP